MIYKDSNKDKPFFTHDKKVDDKNISGGGTATIKSMNSAQEGIVHSYNEITGNYNLN